MQLLFAYFVKVSKSLKLLTLTFQDGGVSRWRLNLALNHNVNRIYSV